MKIKILLLLLVLSVAACRGNSEPANEMTTITSEQVSSDEIESGESIEAKNPPEASTDASIDGLRNPGDLIARFDTNGDGVLQASEAPAQAGRPGAGAPPEGRPHRDVANFVRHFDADGDGLISRAEALEDWSFAEYDANGDGFIDVDEAEQIRPRGNRNRSN